MLPADPITERDNTHDDAAATPATPASPSSPATPASPATPVAPAVVSHPRIALTVVLILLLGIIGSAAGPGWNPQPLTGGLVPETAQTEIGSSAKTDPIGTYQVTAEIIELTLPHGETVKATLRTPDGAIGPRPAVVFLHGTGTSSYRHFEPHAQALTSTGIITLVPQKSLRDYTVRSRNYPEMASDYAAAVRYLHTLEQVDDDQVGVYGESEGAFVAPIVAVEHSGVAFVALISAPVVPIRQQGAFAADAYLREINAPEAMLRAIPRLVGGELPGGGFHYLDFDVGPYQKRMTQPVFMAYGTGDQSMPIVQGPQQLIEDISQVHNDAWTVRYYAKANHGLKIDEQVVPAFTRDLARWINGLPATENASPRVAGQSPVQVYRAAPVASPRWYANGDLILGSFIAGGVLSGIGLLGALSLWFVRRRTPGQAIAARQLTLATGAAPITIAALFAYVVAIAHLALSYEHSVLIVRGGWIVLQIIGVASVIALVRFWHTWHLARLERAPGQIFTFGPLFTGVALIANAGTAILLVTAAYWGLFPLLS